MTNKAPGQREVVTYEETYHRPGRKLRGDFLPTLPSAGAGFVVVEAYVTKAGRVRRGSEELEFQDVRIYLKDPRQATP